MSDDVAAAIKRIQRSRRVEVALETPLRERNAEQAALCALASLAQSGFCK